MLLCFINDRMQTRQIYLTRIGCRPQPD